MSSEPQDFDDIRPYNDAEVPAAIEQIISDPEFIHAIIRFRFGRQSSWLGPIVRPLLVWYLRRHWRSLNSVQAVQQAVAKYLNQTLKQTSNGVSCSGLDKLDPKQAYLFISNHRDIAMDPSLVNWCLGQQGFDTARIAIGDNLLKKPCITALMKLNKSFIVRRSAKGPREMLKALGQLSAYIGHSLSTGHNIWIAQKEGRAKDGFDLTDPAILKMFYIDGKRQGLSFAEYMQKLQIVPVVISYEYDPCDAAKAQELYQIAQTGGYQKTEFEDIDSIIKGITGFKGRVHVHFGAQVNEPYETPDLLAKKLDQEIYQGYQLFPANYLAAGAPYAVGHASAEFQQRLEQMPEAIRPYVLQMYANPLKNAEQAGASL